ncbi:MAG: hypothetical protein GC204_16360 [Chloroflexi bacterium]|nr:hypothetical protein [Chloroflexota bacterium]
MPLGHVAWSEGIILAASPYDKGLRVSQKAAKISSMDENELNPEAETPESDDSFQPESDDTLVLPAADDDADTLILPKAADDHGAYVEAAPDDETLVDLPADYGDNEAAPAEINALDDSEDAPAAVSLPAEDWNLGDIDAALAAVASLSEIMPEREADAEMRADARQGKPTFVPEMRMPPLVTLKRGQLGSLVPALLLIGFGAWLTLTTTTGASPDPLLVVAVIVGGIVLSLLAQWLGTGRWSRGALFFALLVLLAAGVIFFSLQPNGLDFQRGWPLLVVALGLAMGLAGLLARPLNGRLLVPGALTVLAGIVGLTMTLGLLPPDIIALTTPLRPIILVIVLILWLLPLLFRRRRS